MILLRLPRRRHTTFADALSGHLASRQPLDAGSTGDLILRTSASFGSSSPLAGFNRRRWASASLDLRRFFFQLDNSAHSGPEHDDSRLLPSARRSALVSHCHLTTEACALGPLETRQGSLRHWEQFSHHSPAGAVGAEQERMVAETGFLGLRLASGTGESDPAQT